MRRAIVLTLGCVILLSSASALAQPTPVIDEPVEDLAGVVDAEEEADLERRLRRHYEQTGVQMAVLIVDSTGGEPIEDYSMRVAQKWGGGRAGEDRGVLLTLAIEDRRSRLEVGYGLESVITDFDAARLVEQMRPELRREDFGAAVELAVDRVASLTDHLEAGEELSLADKLSLRSVLLWYWVFFFAGAIGFGLLAWRLFERDEGPSRGLAIGVVALAAVASVALVYWMTMRVAPVGYSLTFGVGAIIGMLAVLADFNAWLGFAFWTVIGLFLSLFFGGPMRMELPESANGALIFAALGPHGGVCLLLYLVGRFGGVSNQTLGPDGRRRESSTSSLIGGGSSSGGSYGGGGGSFGGGGASGSW
jgi:uncharacterized protein